MLTKKAVIKWCCDIAKQEIPSKIFFSAFTLKLTAFAFFFFTFIQNELFLHFPLP